MLHQCSESCGWMSGILAALAFGTFGVPIRSTSHLNIDPLVMQVSWLKNLKFEKC